MRWQIRTWWVVPCLWLWLLIPICSAQDAEPEPARAWHGEEFADATMQWVRREHPELKVHSGIKEFRLQDKIGGWERSRGRLSRILPRGLLQLLTSADDFSLLFSLQDGKRIQLAEDTRDLEESLRTWILAQPDNSVPPHVLLGRAIAEARGNSLRALTALWNLSSAGWGAAPGRAANELAMKMIDPTGESSLADGAGRFIILPSVEKRSLADRVKFVVTKRGDKFSTYYHFWGTMTFSHFLSAKYGSRTAGKWLTAGAAKLESIVFRQTSGLSRERNKRIWNDVEGAKAGARLQAILKKPAVLPALKKEAPIDFTVYLKPNPLFAGSYRLESDGRPPAYYGSKTEAKFWDGPMGVEELKIRFAYATRRNAVIFDPVVLASSSDGERLQLGLSKYLQGGAKDEELNGLIEEFYKSKGKKTGMHVPIRGDFNISAIGNKQHTKASFPDFDFSEARRRVDGLIEMIVGRVSSSKNAKCSAYFSKIWKPL